ncbi:hypothetical protein EAG_04252, partial [Camponotus floridanus]
QMQDNSQFNFACNNNVAHFSPEDIQPFPFAGSRFQRIRRCKKRKTASLTDTPEKIVIEKEYKNRKKAEQ